MRCVEMGRICKDIITKLLKNEYHVAYTVLESDFLPNQQVVGTRCRLDRQVN